MSTPSLRAGRVRLPALGQTLDFLTTLWELDHALEVTSSRMKRFLGVTAQQRVIVRIVGRFPSVTAGQLAQLLRIHPGSMSTALARMERRGLLVRDRDPRDKRRVLIGLTAEGRALDMPSPRTVESAVAVALAKVHLDDIDTTRRLLEAVVEALHAAGCNDIDEPTP